MCAGICKHLGKFLVEHNVASHWAFSARIGVSPRVFDMQLMGM